MSAELESRAKAAGFEEFVLDTAPRQTAARGFFDAQGFDCVGETTVEADEVTFELLCYRKRFA